MVFIYPGKAQPIETGFHWGHGYISDCHNKTHRHVCKHFFFNIQYNQIARTSDMMNGVCFCFLNVTCIQCHISRRHPARYFEHKGLLENP